MWKRLAVAAVAMLVMAATASAQSMEPPDQYDPSGCNAYHQMRERLDAIGGTVPKELQTGGRDQTGTVVVDPLYDMLSLQILWSSGVFPCDLQSEPIF